MINFTFDYFDRMKTLDFVLCNINKDRLGVLKVCEHKFTPKVNDIWEVSFKTYRSYDGVVEPLYDRISEMKLIYLPNIAYLKITACDVHSEGEETEYKEVTAKSLECTFGEKYLETFTINMGTTESVDGVQLLNMSDPEHSLMHLVLEKFPNWSIGLVDPSLVTLQRSFQVDKQDVYSFMNTDMADAFECEFDFDTLNNKVNVNPKNETVANPKMVISYNNLLKNATISPDYSAIKTCLSLIGESDLTIREVNMGSDKIYNFDYFHNLEWMSKDLYDALDVWTEKYNTLLPQYTELSTQLMTLINEKYYLTNEMMPEKPDSTDYTEYCLNELETLKKSCENVEDTLRRNNNDQYSEDVNSVYQQLYLPNHQKLLAITAEIKVRKTQIADVDARMETVRKELSDIATAASLESNLSEAELKELSSFIIEDTLNDANFLTTDIMTDAEIIQVKKEFLEHGQKELVRVSQPQFQINADLANLFNIPVFKEYAQELQIGSFLYMKLRDDYTLKLRVLSYTIDFETKDLSVTFGNVNKVRNRDYFEDVMDNMNKTASAATSVSFNMANLKRGSATATEIDNAINAGLISAGNEIRNTYSDAVWNERGLYLNATPDSAYPNDSVFLGAGQVKFSSDGWETCETALGRIEVNGVSTFGLIARMVLAGEVIGSNISGGTITGVSINNGNGTFSVDENGKMKCTEAEISGIVNAKEGTIGGFTIGSYKLYAGDTANGQGTVVVQKPLYSLNSSNSNWVFAAGGSSHNSYADCPFRVNNKGELYATKASIEGVVNANSGSIGGWTIDSSKLTSNEMELDPNGSIFMGDREDGYATITPESIYMESMGDTVSISGDRVFLSSDHGSVDVTAYGLEIGGGDGFVSLTPNSLQIGAEPGKYISLSYRESDGVGWLDLSDTSAWFVLSVDTVQMNGDAYILGGATINGNISTNGTLSVSGASTFNSDATVRGAVTVNSTLWVDQLIRGKYDSSSNAVTITTKEALMVKNYNNDAYQEVRASEFTVSSSEKYKTDIVVSNDVRDVILNGQIYSYRRVSDKENPKQEYGLILERECPEILMNDSKEGIDTYTMLSVLWKDHQRLIQEYEELKERVEILEQSKEQKEIIENAETN